MTGQSLAKWWNTIKPHVGIYRDVWIGVGIVGMVYYKISYGGSGGKAPNEKPSH